MTRKNASGNIAFLILLWMTVASLTACRQLNVYEKNTPVPQYQWQYSFQPGFDFEITDTSATYNIFVVLRHTDAYRYNNIWLNVGTQFPGDSTVKFQRINLSLASDKKGWEGTGMDDIWEVRKPITQGAVPLRKKGHYHFTLAQVMRENPLPHIMSAGIRVERAQ